MKTKNSAARKLLFAGNFILCVGLLLNAFEVVSVSGFRIFVLIGIITDVSGIILAIRKNEF